MGATHKNWSDRSKSNTLGWNSNTKKHGGEKRQVRCFLLDRGYADDIVTMNAVIQSFGKHLKSPAPSCKDIVNNRWQEFKDFIDQNIFP